MMVTGQETLRDQYTMLGSVQCPQFQVLVGVQYNVVQRYIVLFSVLYRLLMYKAYQYKSVARQRSV